MVKIKFICIALLLSFIFSLSISPWTEVVVRNRRGIFGITNHFLMLEADAASGIVEMSVDGTFPEFDKNEAISLRDFLTELINTWPE